jgi:hypothetical protein
MIITTNAEPVNAIINSVCNDVTATLWGRNQTSKNLRQDQLQCWIDNLTTTTTIVAWPNWEWRKVANGYFCILFIFNQKMCG